MILVTGANGHLGKATVEYLLSKVPASDIAVSVRETEKAEVLSQKGISVRQGNFSNPDTLPKAFEGATKLLLISTSEDVHHRTQSHKNAIDAAKKAGVKHIVYTSMIHDGTTSPYHLIKNHLDSEAHLMASGISYTIIREGLYLDYLPMMLGNYLETKQIVYPGGNGQASYVLRNDIAEVLANILASDGHENKIYNITTNMGYNFTEISGILSTITGSTFTYNDIPLGAFADGMRKYGVPEPMVTISVEIASLIREGLLLKPDSTLEKLLGRPPVDVTEFLRNTYMNHR
jgi:NAD(P)H dehydrogenase (quinone)